MNNTRMAASLPSLKTFIGAQKLELMRLQRLTDKLGPKGAISLRSVDGGLQYLSSGRPDVLGKIATSQENMNEIEN